MTSRSEVLALVDEMIADVDRRIASFKAKHIDPNHDNIDYEETLQEALARILDEYRDVIADYVKRGKAIPQSVYDDMTDELQRELESELSAAYIGGATATQAAIDNAIAIDVSWDKPNTNAQEWVKKYTFDLIRGLQDTTIAQVQANIASLQQDISDFFGKPTTLAELRGKIGEYIPDWTDRLGRVWSSPERAKMIATTEVTRASVQGDLDSVQFLKDDYGIEMVAIWQTSNDEIVCDICSPLNGKAQGDGWEDEPPAHPNCRCGISFVLSGGTE